MASRRTMPAVVEPAMMAVRLLPELDGVEVDRDVGTEVVICSPLE